MNIVILTGAGISVESGLSTFSGEGLWSSYRVQDICTPDALSRNPSLVCEFYDVLKKEVAIAQPNSAHIAVACLGRFWRENRLGSFLLITQNIDDLHERAGSLDVVHLHGRLNSAFCLDCGWQGDRFGPLEDNRYCPSCDRESLRPDIVLFGEAPRHMNVIESALKSANLFAAIGTSGTVYPAAEFVDIAKSFGAKGLYFNTAEPIDNHRFDKCHIGNAGKTVPEWVSELLHNNPK